MVGSCWEGRRGGEGVGEEEGERSGGWGGRGVGEGGGGGGTGFLGLVGEGGGLIEVMLPRTKVMRQSKGCAVLFGRTSILLRKNEDARKL